MVAVDLKPRRCASRWTSSHASGPPFFGAMRLRTRVKRTSAPPPGMVRWPAPRDRKSTRLNSSHGSISYAVFCLKKKKSNESQGIPRKHSMTAYPRQQHRSGRQDTDEKATHLDDSTHLLDDAPSRHHRPELIAPD